MEDVTAGTTRDPATVGPYRLIRKLGEGGMGVVHLAVDPSGRAVALKVLRAHVANDEEARRRLGREVATLRRVRHPQVAEVIDADVDGDLPYLVTRFVPGRSLEDEVRATGPLPAGHVARVGRHLAGALSAIHAVGVVHRDLKPANVMLVDGDPVLIDFGIAHAADESRITRTGLVMGTPGYLSPELIYGDPVTAATDWWAWGATLAFAATGRQPFGTGPIEVILERVRKGTSDLDGVDPALRDLLRRTLTVDADARPAAAELTAALDGVIAGVPTVPAEARGADRPAGAPRDERQAAHRAATTDLPAGRPAARQAPSYPPRTSRPAPRVAPTSQLPAAPTPAAPAYPGAGVYPPPPSYPTAQPYPPAPQYPPPAHPYPPAQQYPPPAQPYPPSAQPYPPPDQQYPPTHRYPPAPTAQPYPHAQPYPPAQPYPTPAPSATGERRSADGRRPGGGREPADVPAGPRRVTPYLAAGMAALCLVAAVAPVGAVVLAVLLGVVARTVQRSGTGLERRRAELGRSRTDVAVTVAALPWRLLTAGVVSVVAAVLPLLVAASVTFIAGSLIGSDGQPHPSRPLPLVLGMAAGLATSWWGPGGWGLRTGTRSVARAVTGTRLGQIVVLVLCFLVALAVIMVGTRAGHQPDWTPFDPPWSVVR